LATLPTGTVTFLFSDIEGSTELVQQLGSQYRKVLETHQRLLRAAFADGVEIGTEGDSFFVAFDTATKAVAAAVAAQLALAGEEWSPGRSVGVRMGLHTGNPSLGGDSYVGIDVHRAARIAAAGHGGQVLVSESTHALVRRELPNGVTIRDLGQHRLKDLALPEHIYQLVIPGLSIDFPPLRSLDVSRTNLPLQLTSFIGRERELAELKVLVSTHRLVSIVGTGGAGKTRLMMEVASELTEDFPDGAWLVELAPVSDPDLVSQAAAGILGVRDEPGRPMIETLSDFLRSKSLLLMLDNCEHVIGSAAEMVEQLLRGSPALVALASSREALGVPGEAVFQVPSLNVPGPLGGGNEERTDGWFDQVVAAEAVRLFVDRARAVMPSFSLTPSDAAAVVEICRRLDGIPLAIELAAARVTHLSVQEIAVRLGDRFRLLTGGRRTAVPRQQTLQALIDWSWDLLADTDRRLLRRLSVFAGGCTLEEASAITSLPGDRPEAASSEAAHDGGSLLDTLEGLGRLLDRSLLIADHRQATRYRLLETIRQYARDRLVDSGEAGQIRGRHIAHFLDLAEEAAPLLRGPDMVAWLAQLDSEADNLRAALEWALEADPEAALRLCVAMQFYWRVRSMSEGVERLGRAARIVPTLLPPAPGSERERAILVANVLAAAAMSTWIGGNVTSASVHWAEEAVEIGRAMEDAAALSQALGALAMSTIFSGREDGVMEFSEESIGLAESAHDWFSVSFGQAGLAQWELQRGRLAVAEARLVQATEAANRSGNPAVIAFSALTRGRLSGFSRLLPEARGWFGKAVAAYEEIGDERMALVSRSDLAHALRAGDAIEEAVALYRQTLRGWQRAGNRGAIANQLESFALVAMRTHDPVRAAQLFGAAEAIREAAEAAMPPWERVEYDAAVAGLRAALDPATLESGWADGHRLTIDQAVELALSSTGARAPH
jgi:predicted ATPase/class 3 adenylate cyclase